MDRTFILMYSTGIGLQQVRETGIFSSKRQAENFLTYNGHLMVDDNGHGRPIDPATVKVMEILPAEAAR